VCDYPLVESSVGYASSECLEEGNRFSQCYEGEKSAAHPVLPVPCWLSSVYQILICGSEKFRILKFAEVNAAIGSSFVEYSLG